jgi:hypothetical protein
MSVSLFIDLPKGIKHEGRSESDFSNDRWNALLSAIDGNMAVSSRANGNCGDVVAEDVPAFLSKVIRALNSSKLSSHERQPVQNGNWYTAGIDREYLERKLGEIAELCCNAVSLHCAIYWG